MTLRTTTGALLFLYYFVIVLASGWLWCKVLFATGDMPSEVSVLDAMRLGATSAAAFGSLLYSRKLYKDLFAMVEEEGPVEPTRTLATIAYYVFRPIFSVFLSSVFVLATFAFMHLMSAGEVRLGPGYAIFVSIGGAFIASATGRAIGRLLSISEEVMPWLRLPN